jgi:hypothetical protein
MIDPPDPSRGELPRAPRPPAEHGSNDPLVPADFSSWMGKMVDAVGRSWRPVGLLQLVLVIPLAIVLALFEQAAGSRMGVVTVGNTTKLEFDHPGAAAGLAVVLVVVAVVLGALVQLACLWIVVKEADNQPIDPAQVARFAFSRVLPMIGWEIVAGLLVAIGLIAILLPGIYLGVVLLPTILGVVGLERAGIRRCFELARGRFFALLGRCCVAVLIAAAYSELVQVITNIIFGRDATGWGVQVVAALLQLPLDVAGVAFLVVTYAELRGAHGPASTRQLSAALDG